MTSQKTAHLTKHCACAVKSSSTLHPLTFPHVSSLCHTNLTRYASIQNPLQKLPQGERRSALLRTVDNGNAQTTSREQGSTPRPPELNENPLLRIREKLYMIVYGNAKPFWYRLCLSTVCVIPSFFGGSEPIEPCSEDSWDPGIHHRVLRQESPRGTS